MLVIPRRLLSSAPDAFPVVCPREDGQRENAGVQAVLERPVEHGAGDVAGLFARAFDLAMRIERALRHKPERCRVATGKTTMNAAPLRRGAGASVGDFRRPVAEIP